MLVGGRTAADVLAVTFGLATDYETFLLSRVREAWDRTGDTAASVAIGVQRTAGIITAAALLLGRSWLAGFYRRYGIHEPTEWESPLFATTSVAR